MSKDPLDKARAGLEEAWKAARSAAGGVKKEIERAGIAKTIDDAGREIARAATSVASHLGAELEELGREIRTKAEGAAGESPPPTSPAPTPVQSAPQGQTTQGQSQGGQSQGQGPGPTEDDGTRTPRPGGVRIASD